MVYKNILVHLENLRSSVSKQAFTLVREILSQGEIKLLDEEQ
jgi:hypothetical protein